MRTRGKGCLVSSRFGNKLGEAVASRVLASGEVGSRESPLRHPENVPAGTVALSLGKARCSNTRRAKGVGQRQEGVREPPVRVSYQVSIIQMRPRGFCPQSCQPRHERPRRPPRQRQCPGLPAAASPRSAHRRSRPGSRSRPGGEGRPSQRAHSRPPFPQTARSGGERSGRLRVHTGDPASKAFLLWAPWRPPAPRQSSQGSTRPPLCVTAGEQSWLRERVRAAAPADTPGSQRAWTPVE